MGVKVAHKIHKALYQMPVAIYKEFQDISFCRREYQWYGNRVSEVYLSQRMVAVLDIPTEPKCSDITITMLRHGFLRRSIDALRSQAPQFRTSRLYHSNPSQIRPRALCRRSSHDQIPDS